MQWKLNTPKVNSMSDIKTEIIEQLANKIHTRFTYPNGLILDFVQTSDGVVDLKTNWSVKEEADGSISFLPPES